MTAPCPASDTPVIPGLRGATWTLVKGAAFCITQTSGDILQGEPRGLFVQDACVLSRWSLTIRGRPAEPLAVLRADRYAAVPPRGQWLIAVEAAPVHDGSPMTLHHPCGQIAEHARAASGVPRGDGGPGRAADTPPGDGQPWGGS